MQPADQRLCVCSWCKKVKRGGEWVKPDTDLTEQELAVATHGICPACAERVQTPLPPSPERPRGRPKKGP